MRIFGKILAITLPVLILGLLGVGWMASGLARHALDDLAEKWLATKLDEAMHVVREDEEVLRRFGLEKVGPNVAKAQADAAGALSGMRIGKDGHVVVVDEQGTIVLHPEAGLAGLNVGDRDWFARLGKSATGKLDLTWDNGQQSLVRFERFEPWGWYVLATAPRDEVYGEVNRLQGYALGAALLLAGVAVLLHIILVRYIVAPLHELVKVAEDIGRGRLDSPVTVSTNDEIGLLAATIADMQSGLRESYADLEKRIAERGQAQNALREQLHYTQALINAVPDPVFFKDLNFNYLGCNTAFARFAGLENEDVAGKTDFDIFDVRTAEIFRNMDKRMLITWRTKSNHFMARASGGGNVHYDALISPLKSPSGGIIGIVGSMRDLTQIREASENLHRSEIRHRSIFEHSGMGIALLDLDGHIISANPALAKMYGRPREELAGQALESLLVIEDKSLLDRLGRLTTLAAETMQAEMGMRQADNGSRWVHMTLTQVRSRLDRPQYAIAMIEDIEARKAAENELADLNRHLEEEVGLRTRDLAHKAAELENANQELKKLDELKSAFVSSVSHELRTPLTSLMGYSKIIQRDFRRLFLPLTRPDTRLSEKGERILHNLDVIGQEGERLTRLINNVLDMNKIESGRMDWMDAEIDVARIARQAVDAVRGQVEERRDLSLELHVADGLPRTYISPDKLMQVLINLLTNALKHTRRGRIVLKVEAPLPDCLRLIVADTGLGIPQGELHKVFDAFHQVYRHDTLTDKSPGSGLGLAICSQIIEHYGGLVWAESTPGRGSEFIIELPVTALPAQTGE